MERRSPSTRAASNLQTEWAAGAILGGAPRGHLPITLSVMLCPMGPQRALQTSPGPPTSQINTMSLCTEQPLASIQTAYLYRWSLTSRGARSAEAVEAAGA